MSRSSLLTQNKEKLLEAEFALNGLFSFCEEHGYGLAIWREPGDSQVQGVIDFNETEWNHPMTLEEMPGGFLFAPYNRQNTPHFIQANVYFVISEHLVLKSGSKAQQAEITQYLNEVPLVASKKEVQLTELPASADKMHFINLVENAVENIRKGSFLKVVPSRSKAYQVHGLDIPRLFLALQKTYLQAFVSATYTPEHGLWIGASPELLVRVSDDKIFETISLAGTQPFRENISMGDIAWTQKEIEEQALVSRYIINCFKKIRLREFDELGPKTVVAGNLIHLKTRFIVDMEATGFQQLGSVMLDLLHPTSAICGMPMDSANEWLKKNENYDREFFSGFLGPVNLKNKTSLFVNLRCMKIESDEVHFFAGAGVTEDSRPEKEWLETEMKMQTLLNVIREHPTHL